ncbi:MAG: NAD(P)/FAD-dependent oxidoreductase [Nocardioides sp.]
MPEHLAGAARPALLLVGAGHAHLHLLDRAADLAPHYDVVLVAPHWFHYSGTASAVATGDLPASTGRIDVAALAARRGVRHVVGRLVDLDVAARTARCEDGTELSFDLVSLNLGSVVPPLPPAPAAAPPPLVEVRAQRATRPSAPTPHVVPVKPLTALPALGAAARRGERVTVVGGGSSALELAAHAAAAGARVTLVAQTFGAELPPGARRRLRRVLAPRGVEVREGRAAREVGDGEVRLDDGASLPHDLVVLATGLAAPPEVARWGLGDERGIPVTATLTHPDHPHVLATGDCARFLPRDLPRVGVHGARQGPVLRAGLLARARGGQPPAYDPPARWLSVLDLGGGRALAVRGRWWWEGRAALRLKRRIDRRWLSGYAAPSDPG